MPLKAYTLGNNGFVGREVLDALGEPGHTRQASVMVFARTKAEAIRTIEDRPAGGIWAPRISEPEFRMVDGPYADAFLGCWVDGPDIIVTPLTSGWPTPVVRVTADNIVEFWGVLRRIGSQVVFSKEVQPA